MRKPLTSYKAVLFDVDGTLYMQNRLRPVLAARLAKYYLLHPLRLKELLILIKYRSVRESWTRILDALPYGSQASASMETLQYRYTADCLNTSPDRVKETVFYWMHRYPLPFLPKYQDKRLIDILCYLQKQSLFIAAYSDYPPQDKLKMLHIAPDFIFSSSDPDINCMKPNPDAVYAILKRLDLTSEDVLMIGDRYSKDGLAAQNTGMDFIILGKSMPQRNALYSLIFPGHITP